MQKLTIPNSSVQDLENLLNENPDYIVGARLMALIQIKRGMSSRKLEELYFKSHSRFCVWVNNFNKYGIEGLKNKPKSGRKPLLTEEQKEEMKSVLLNNRPENLGFNSATWNGPILIEYIMNKYGVSYKKAQIYNILKQLGFSYQKSKGRYPEAEPLKQKEFVESLKKTHRRTKR
jgi:transposase